MNFRVTFYSKKSKQGGQGDGGILGEGVEELDVLGQKTGTESGDYPFKGVGEWVY